MQEGVIKAGRSGHEASFSITGARLVDPWVKLDMQADLHVADGRIIAVGAAPHGFRPARTIDGTGLVVSPGLVDLSARLREPGFEYKASLESEMQAAVAGGVTALACPPAPAPPLDEPGLVEMLKYRAHNLGLAHLYPLGALTVGLKGQALTEMAELTAAGCVGFAQASQPIQDTQVLLRAMQYAHSFGYTVWLNPVDPFLSRGGVMHAGPFASRLGLPGNPVTSETVALHTICELVASVGCPVHLCRLSSAAGVELVRQARKAGLPITADDTAASLHDRLMTLGSDTLLRTLPDVLAQNRAPVPQATDGITYAHKLNKAEARLDWHNNIITLDRKIRAYNPTPIAHTTLDDEPLRIHAAHILNHSATAAPGTIVAHHADGLDVACIDGTLRITRLQLPGKSATDAAALRNSRDLSGQTLA